MDELDLQLDDVVLFELPTHADVEAFCDRLRSNWPGWSEADGDVWLFAVDVEDRADDLAPLFRTAQELVGELGLASIRFYLDSRIYHLEAAPSRSLSASSELTAIPLG
jgi:hypothetical protein